MISSTFVTISDEKYKRGDFGTVKCPQGYSLLTNSSECEGEAKKRFNKPFFREGCFQFGAVGCAYTRYVIFFNTCIGINTRGTYASLCVKGRLKITIDSG